MLVELKVSHFAIIDNIHIHFKSGLNVLSGETGSGKSVLLKSLALLMGGKASSDIIRTGHSQAVVEGRFDLVGRKDIEQLLESLGIETEDKSLIVRRIISAEDKSKIYLNGSLSTLNALRDIVAPLIEVTGHHSPLIEMTGQHDNRHLLSKAYHLDLLDQYTGALNKRMEYHEKFILWHKLQTEIVDLEKNAAQKAQRLDFLLFQKAEIEKLDLNPGEDHQIEHELKKVKNFTKISQFVDLTEAALYTDDDSAIVRLNSVLKKSAEISQLDPVIAEKVEALNQAKSLIDDCVYSLRQYASQIDGDATQLDALESRLSDLRKLQKKYGPTVDDILKAMMEFEIEINNLQNSDTKIESLKKQVATLEKELMAMAKELHKKRVSGAQLLADSVNKELADLNMKGVTFHVQVQASETLNQNGLSDVEFLSQNSTKDPLRSLSKVSSGGELSRILLSLKRVVGHSSHPRTYLFDEVDTGVSGQTAEKVGKKLKSIAKNQQVICVTHLPQVAACGDHHFYISKSPTKDSVSMTVSELKAKDRIDEIARLISGEKVTKTSLAHAKELLNLV